MLYREFSAPDALVPFVQCLWTLDGAVGDGEAAIERAVPDGCAELVIHHGDRFFRHSGGERRMQARALAVGQMTGPVLLEPSGNAGVVGARLRPAAARAVFLVPMRELTDRIEPLDSVLGQTARDLETRVGESSPMERLSVLAEFLERRLADVAPPDPAVEAALRTAEKSGGRSSVGDLALAARVGRRQLERRFAEEVGLTPKVFSRITRLQSVLTRLRHHPSVRWVREALSAGYFDQAHLVRDFRAFTGLPPTGYLAEYPDVAFFQSRNGPPS